MRWPKATQSVATDPFKCSGASKRNTRPGLTAFGAVASRAGGGHPRPEIPDGQCSNTSVASGDHTAERRWHHGSNTDGAAARIRERGGRKSRSGHGPRIA